MNEIINSGDAKEDKENLPEQQDILYIDTEPLHCGVVVGAMKRQNKLRSIDGVNTVEEALALIAKKHYTGIITDGLEDRWPEIADKADELGIPIKMCSGRSKVLKAFEERYDEQSAYDRGEFYNRKDLEKLFDFNE